MNMIKLFGNLTIRVWMIAAFADGLLFFETRLDAAAQTAATRSVKTAAEDAVEEVIKQFEGDATCFGRKVKLGKQDIFKKALAEVDYSTDPGAINPRAKAQLQERWAIFYNPKNLMLLPFDPREKISKYNKLSIYHEAIHQIESLYGVLRDETIPGANRNAIYFCDLIGMLTTWAVYEKQIKEGKPDVDLDNLHDEYRKLETEFRDLEKKLGPDIREMEVWAGIRVRFDDIQNLYLSGDCDPKLKAFAEKHAAKYPPSVPPAGGVVSTKQNQTGRYCTNNPNIKTEFPTPPWLKRGDPDHPTSRDYKDMVLKLIDALKEQGMDGPRLEEFMNLMTNRIWTDFPEEIDKRAQWEGRPAGLPDLKDKQAVDEWREKMAASFLAEYQRILASGSRDVFTAKMLKLGQKIKDFDPRAAELANRLAGESVSKQP